MPAQAGIQVRKRVALPNRHLDARRRGRDGCIAAAMREEATERRAYEMPSSRTAAGRSGITGLPARSRSFASAKAGRPRDSRNPVIPARGASRLGRDDGSHALDRST